MPRTILDRVTVTEANAERLRYDLPLAIKPRIHVDSVVSHWLWLEPEGGQTLTVLHESGVGLLHRGGDVVQGTWDESLSLLVPDDDTVPCFVVQGERLQEVERADLDAFMQGDRPTSQPSGEADPPAEHDEVAPAAGVQARHWRRVVKSRREPANTE